MPNLFGAQRSPSEGLITQVREAVFDEIGCATDRVVVIDVSWTDLGRKPTLVEAPWHCRQRRPATDRPLVRTADVGLSPLLRPRATGSSEVEVLSRSYDFADEFSLRRSARVIGPFPALFPPPHFWAFLASPPRCAGALPLVLGFREPVLLPALCELAAIGFNLMRVLRSSVSDVRSTVRAGAEPSSGPFRSAGIY